eukprot:Nk52_evm8s503 gene=Nk52_evmTU8s503
MPHDTREEKTEKAKLVVKVREWHKIWETADLDTVGDWYNEDPGEHRFFAAEEMVHYIERRGRTVFTEEMKQWTTRVIGNLQGRLERVLQNKPREPIEVGDWVQLNADDNASYRYRVMKKKRRRVYVTYADIDQIIDRWKLKSLSLKGKATVYSSLIASKIWYWIVATGNSKQVIKRMQTRLKEIMNYDIVALETITQAPKNGGFGILRAGVHFLFSQGSTVAPCTFQSPEDET